eukprot:Awhi_evm1s10821
MLVKFSRPDIKFIDGMVSSQQSRSMPACRFFGKKFSDANTHSNCRSRSSKLIVVKLSEFVDVVVAAVVAV